MAVSIASFNLDPGALGAGPRRVGRFRSIKMKPLLGGACGRRGPPSIDYSFLACTYSTRLCSLARRAAVNKQFRQRYRNDHHPRTRFSKPETHQRMLELGIEHSRRSRAEPGCLAHNCHVDAETPNKIMFVEKWVDMAAVQARCCAGVWSDGQGNEGLVIEPGWDRTVRCPAARRSVIAGAALVRHTFRPP